MLPASAASVVVLAAAAPRLSMACSWATVKGLLALKLLPEAIARLRTLAVTLLERSESTTLSVPLALSAALVSMRAALLLSLPCRLSWGSSLMPVMRRVICDAAAVLPLWPSLAPML